MAASTLHSDSFCDEHLIADAGVLHIEGNHFAQAEAHDGDRFDGFGGQGIEVEDEDANKGVGQNHSDGAASAVKFRARAERMAAVTASGARRFGSSMPGMTRRPEAERRRRLALAGRTRLTACAATGRAAASTPSGEISTAAGGRSPDWPVI